MQVWGVAPSAAAALALDSALSPLPDGTQLIVILRRWYVSKMLVKACARLTVLDDWLGALEPRHWAGRRGSDVRTLT